MRHVPPLAALAPLVLAFLVGMAWADSPAPEADAPEAEAPAPEAAPAPDARARDWLRANQHEDGSWGKGHTVAITGLACLSFLTGEDRPFDGERSTALVKGLAYLLAVQKQGMFPNQGHTWIHGQGFATLAMSEAYGRIVRDGAKPDLDVAALEKALPLALAVIEKNQSTSGGWWYVPGNPHDHEGSTTVCAVQALVSGSNHGFPTDRTVLARGFEYLKKCQNPVGGFDY